MQASMHRVRTGSTSPWTLGWTDIMASACMGVSLR
jgi:hypothetical protein